MTIPSDLYEGYRRFRAHGYASHERRYRQIAEGQAPDTMVIGCADSRVDPATIFDAKPGELFVVRNVAALVPACGEDGACSATSAALEFAVTSLKVKRIVVMGHGSCGGVAASLAAAERHPVGTFIGPWVAILGDARDELLDRTPSSDSETRQRDLEHMAVRQSLKNLLTFPFVSAAVNGGLLELEGAWFSIAEGQLHWLDRNSDTFLDITVGTDAAN